MTKYDETSTNNDSKPFNTFRKSRIKRTTDQGKVATILKCNTVDIKVAEIFALAQPDAIWLCMEHGSLDYNQAENQSNAAKIYDVDSLLRVNRGSYSNYIRGFEVDCTGLIIPQIKSLADAKEIEEFNPFWFEEPVLAENVDALASAKKVINIPVVTGEELYTKFEFREIFEKQAADIINPDVCNVGGILELKEIAAMAEPYYVAVSPHNYNSTTLGLSATIQVSAAIPNFLITEYFVNFENLGKDISTHPFEVDNGYIKLPTEPGLGMDLIEENLEKYPYKQFPPRNLAQYSDEGP